MGHWADGTLSGGREAAMDPSVTLGTRKTYTPLDFAGLADIGWTLLPPPRLGDMNGDGAANNLDIGPFALALANPLGFRASYPSVDVFSVGDINTDGRFDNLDIGPFASLLSGGGATAVPEPSTTALIVAGLSGGLVWGIRRWRSNACSCARRAHL
jgi:hypothetical protein